MFFNLLELLMKTKIFCIIFLIIFISGNTLSASSVVLTKEEEKFLTDHPIFNVAPDPYFPPIEFFDKDNHYCGLAADYFRILAD